MPWNLAVSPEVGVRAAAWCCSLNEHLGELRWGKKVKEQKLSEGSLEQVRGDYVKLAQTCQTATLNR